MTDASDFGLVLPPTGPQTFGVTLPSSAPKPTDEKVYYNDLGQPFTRSGKPPAAPDTGYTGSVLPLRRDASGLHLAFPESIASTVRGMEEGGKRALGVGEAGQNPLRPLSPDELAATASVGALPLRAGGAALPVAKAGFPASGVSPERAALAKEALDLGIPITAPQIGMSRTGKYADAAIRGLPLSGAREHELAQQQAFNRAVARTFGEDSATITPSEMAAAKQRLGGVINRIENGNQVKLDAQAFNKLAAIETVARAALSDEEFSVVKRQLDNVLAHLTPDDKLAGTTVGALLRKGGPLDRAIGNNNSNIAHTAQAIKTVVQDALQDSLSPEDMAAYRDARFQYKNMKTIEPLVNKSAHGDISPALLNARVTAQFPNRAYDTTGQNHLDRLAKIGQAFLKEPGSSGTAERGATIWGLGELGKLGAAALAGDVLGIPALAGGAAATLGAGRLTGKVLRSPRLARRAVERGLNPPVPKPPSAPLPYMQFLVPGTLDSALGAGNGTKP